MNKVDISNNEYKTDFLCTYHYIKNYDESYMLYQIQFLQVFNLAKFDENIINRITENLYMKYKNNKYIIGIINSNIINNDSNIDDLTKFRTYFNYDTFNILHHVLCNIINNSTINIENYNKLIN
jgi:hypothetical protein